MIESESSRSLALIRQVSIPNIEECLLHDGLMDCLQRTTHGPECTYSPVVCQKKGESMGIYGDFAKKYFEAGYSVLPVWAKEKACFIDEWTKIFCKTMPSEVDQDRYIEEHSQKLIGIALGPASQLCAVDFDYIGPFAKVVEEMLLGVIPPSIVSKTGAKGWTKFYKFNGLPSRGINRMGKRMVDFLSDGRLTVLPPSPHKESKVVYHWTTPDTLLDISPDDLPEITAKHIDSIDFIANLTNEYFHREIFANNRNARIYGYVVSQSELSASLDDLIESTMAYDNMVHKSDPSGPYFKDKKYMKSKTSEELCRYDVNRIITYKQNKLKERGVSWSLGSDSNLKLKKSKMGVLSTLENVYEILTKHDRFKDKIWYETFSDTIYVDIFESGSEISESIKIELTRIMQVEFNLNQLSTNIVSQALMLVAYNNKRNELTNYLNSLSWDGIERAGRFFIDYYGCEDNEYSRAVSINFLVSLMARAFRPGSKVDNMVVLEGLQGHYKSTSLERLVGEKWYLDTAAEIAEKDFLMNLKGKWLIEIAELESLDRASINRLKQFVTCKVDRYRKPYAEWPANHPRSCVFVGTTNDDRYLGDPTGGRRFWPIEIKSIDLAKLTNNREQLLAEAANLFKNGATWYEVPASAAEEQEARRVIDPWEEAISKYLSGLSEVSSYVIASNCLKIFPGQIDKSVEMRIGRCLRVLGWRRDRKRVEGRNVRLWRRGDELPKVEASKTVDVGDYMVEFCDHLENH